MLIGGAWDGGNGRGREGVGRKEQSRAERDNMRDVMRVWGDGVMG